LIKFDFLLFLNGLLFDHTHRLLNLRGGSFLRFFFNLFLFFLVLPKTRSIGLNWDFISFIRRLVLFLLFILIF
jgi:hypothetical protein